MSHSPIKPTSPASHSSMLSELAPASTFSPYSPVEIKQELDIEPPTLLTAGASRLTPIPIISPTPTPASALASTDTDFAPVATHASASAPALAATAIPSVRKTGRQGRLPKERVLVRNQPAEVVNYPCYEQTQLSDFHRQKLQELDVYPIDGVSNYSRSIPFKGAKESFLKRTGRNRFDVFEYRFTAPNTRGEDKQWWVMWDYYNGLVRVHDFFDCCRPGKTEPGNAVKEKVNPGLQNVCHNITGGNLHAQGYWIPFLAAKALATKFCFRIRYALTIIFGDDFPSQCLPETDPEFGKYQISSAVIQSCQDISAQQFATETERATPAPSTPLNFSSGVSSTSTPGSASSLANKGEKLVYQQRISITPDRTAANRYFDPVRGGYTNGSSSSSSSTSSGGGGQLAPVRYNTTATARIKTMAKKIPKVHKTPRGSSSGAVADSPSGLKIALQNRAVPVQLPPMGNFPPIPTSNVRRLSQLGARHPNGKTGMQRGIGSDYFPQVNYDMVSPTDSEGRVYPSRKRSLSPSTGSEGRRGGSSKRQSLRIDGSLAPQLSPRPPAEHTFGSPNPETSEEPAMKRLKVLLSEPRVYTNPFMRPTNFCAGTFTNPRRASRDSSIPEPANPYTRARYNELVSSQVEEDPEYLLVVEAAGQLMELQRRDYETDFVQRKKVASSTLKRRRSG